MATKHDTTERSNDAPARRHIRDFECFAAKDDQLAKVRARLTASQEEYGRVVDRLRQFGTEPESELVNPVSVAAALIDGKKLPAQPIDTVSQRRELELRQEIDILQRAEKELVGLVENERTRCGRDLAYADPGLGDAIGETMVALDHLFAALDRVTDEQQRLLHAGASPYFYADPIPFGGRDGFEGLKQQLKDYRLRMRFFALPEAVR